MTATSKSLLKAGWSIGVGVIVINAIIYWRNTGFEFSSDILTLAIPAVVFSWLTTALCGMAIRLFGNRGAAVSAFVLIALHVAALVYFLYAMSGWREGTEFAQLIIIQLLFAISVLCFAVLRPIIKAKANP